MRTWFSTVKKRHYILLAIFLAALVVRLVYVAEVGAKSPFYDYLVCDAFTYHDSALEIVGQVPPGEFLHMPYHHPPLYPHFLATIYRVFSVSVLGPRIVQALLGALSCILIFLIAERYFSFRVAVVAGFAAVFYRSFIFFDGEILTASVGMFLGLLGLYLATLSFSEEYSDSRKRYWLVLACGLSLGLLAITIPNILLFGAFLAIYIALSKQLKERWIMLGCFLTALLVPATIATVRNCAVSGEFVFICHEGGEAFYVGNNLRSEETSSVRPGAEWGEILHIPEAETGRAEMTEAQKSWHFFKKGFSYIFSHPFHYVLSQGRKVVRFFNHVEIGRNADFYYLVSFSGILSYNPVTYLFVSPLAMLGLYFFFKRRRHLILLYVYFALYFLSVVAFLVAGRYRIPVLPIMIIFASAAVFELLDLRSDRKLLARYLAVLAGLFVFVSVDWFGDYAPPEGNVENYLITGRAYLSRGEMEKALCCQLQALGLEPGNAQARLETGLILRRMGDLPAAQKAFEAVIELDPRSPGPHIALAVLKGERGDFQAAVRHYAAAARIGHMSDSNWFAVLIGLGRSHFQLGDYENAEKVFKEAIETFPGNPEGPLCLGGLYGTTGRIDEAVAVFKQVISAHPNCEKAYNDLLFCYIKRGEKRDAAAIRQLLVEAMSRGVTMDSYLLLEAKKILGE